jgi:hypothetical protein
VTRKNATPQAGERERAFRELHRADLPAESRVRPGCGERADHVDRGVVHHAHERPAAEEPLHDQRRRTSAAAVQNGPHDQQQRQVHHRARGHLPAAGQPGPGPPPAITSSARPEHTIGHGGSGRCPQAERGQRGRGREHEPVVEPEQDRAAHGG